MGDHAIWAESPWFSPGRNRPPARRRHGGWRRNRTSARVSLPISNIFSAELTARAENHEHARNSRTKCRLGAVPVAFFVLGRRKPMAAKKLSDVAVSAVSPLLSHRRHRPLGRTSVTSAKESSEALRRRCSPAGVADQAERNRRPHIKSEKSPSRQRGLG